MATSIYLDYNASAPVRPAVIEAMTQALAAGGNPSSVHGAGRASRRRIEEARDDVANLVGAAADEVVFTSGGTEANALALLGCDAEQVMVSAIEHLSVRQAVPDALQIPVLPDGVIDLDAAAAMLDKAKGKRVLVSVMLANNEIGTIQPVAELARMAHDKGALVHCDAVQAAGKIAFTMAQLEVDLLSLSAHKIGGPQGCGALIVRGGTAEIDLNPILRGGGQERGLRAGTENVAGIAGFGAAAREAKQGFGDWRRVEELRDQLEGRIAQAIPQARIFGAKSRRLPNTICVALPGVPAQTQVMVLDLANVQVSAGSACSSGKVAPSHVLKAMGVPPDLAACAIRISLGWTSGADDIDAFMSPWAGLAAQTRNTKAANAA